MKFISSPKASQVLSLSVLRVPFTVGFFSYILFTFTSFLLNFVSLNKLVAFLVELKMIIFLFTFTDEKFYMGKEGISCFSGRSEINIRKEKKYFRKREGFKMHNLHTNRSEVSRKFVDCYFTKSWCSGVAKTYATD